MDSRCDGAGGFVFRSTAKHPKKGIVHGSPWNFTLNEKTATQGFKVRAYGTIEPGDHEGRWGVESVARVAISRQTSRLEGIRGFSEDGHW